MSPNHSILLFVNTGMKRRREEDGSSVCENRGKIKAMLDHLEVYKANIRNCAASITSCVNLNSKNVAQYSDFAYMFTQIARDVESIKEICKSGQDVAKILAEHQQQAP